MNKKFKIIFLSSVSLIVLLIAGLFYVGNLNGKSTKETFALGTHDKDKEELINLLVAKDYEKALSKSSKQDTDFKRDIYLISGAFLKQEEIDNEDESLISKIHDYKDLVSDIEVVKNVPKEVQSNVDALYENAKANLQYLVNKSDAVQSNLKGVPEVGMSKSEVLSTTWGNPIDINTTKTASSNKEQWVYSGYKYVYFEDGVVTTIQE
ncbi:hypothetical protein [Fictibacillus sp. S7]|uniref:hypothetical protein n=1 Tax=Fictibacillus sp. S7 TaxID=2212476 RepID=UPI00101188C2|nr:hypothetical protein [Fictibacillus sp. S7]RXZ00845.1 hypothetical protein DMO16_14870 [Fictibacillus sp. S7]